MDRSNSRRIVLLGKTGSGKSSLGNTIFQDQVFQINNTAISGKNGCQAKTKPVNGRSVTVIDTPGFFDTDRSEEELKPEILRCITECAPGPHAFLIVLKVEKFTEQEQAVVKKIRQCFSEEALKYAIIVFTNGEQLKEGTTLEDFIGKNDNLRDLVMKCGGRCHVVDNERWKTNRGDEYRSNQFQVAALLKTLDEMIDANNGSCYTNETLQAVEEEIRREELVRQESDVNTSQTEIREEAKKSVFKTFWIKCAGITTGALLGAFLGVAEKVIETVFKSPSDVPALVTTEEGRKTALTAAYSGMVRGAQMGNAAAETAETPLEAMKKAADSVWKKK